MAVMYCPKCIVEVMDLINHEEGTENEVREEFEYVVDTYKCPMCGHEVEDYMEDEE